MKKNILLLASVAALVFLSLSPVAHAFTTPGSGQSPTPPAPVTDAADLSELLCSIVGWFFWIVIVISIIMILFSAYTYVTARDDQEKTSKARKTLTYAAVGIAVALIAGGFPTLIASVFPGNPDIPSFGQCI